MKYEKDLMASWDEYSIRKTIENERKKDLEKALKEGREEGLEKGLEKGMEKGMEKKSFEVVKNLLSTSKFTIAEIANFASVSEPFVRKVKKEIK